MLGKTSLAIHFQAFTKTSINKKNKSIMNFKIIFTSLFAFVFSIISFAQLPPKKGNKETNQSEQQAAYRSDCSSATAQIDLAINNVRARLSTSGDSWWKKSEAGYIVPKPEPGEEGVSSIFAGALWLAGIDEGGNLKTACQTYGSVTGDDEFWPGPLADDGLTDADNCANWDRFFTVSKTSVDLFKSNWAKALSENRTELNPDEIPEEIKGWPALGNPFFEDIYGFALPPPNSGYNGLADFWDQGGVAGKYEPQFGDFPVLRLDGNCNTTVPDQMIFSIINDGGGIHSNSNGDAILMEIQTTAFAFKTNDEINNMTFYSHRMINRAIESIDSTYIGLWVNPDLGCYSDDYIGCDVDRNLAYAYNSDALDGNANCDDCLVPTYCTDIPAVGIDLFKGPMNELGEELGMSTFTYYDGSPYYTANAPNKRPKEATGFYHYLSGSWRDGTPLTQGGSGYNPSSQEIVKHAFSSPPNDPMGWNMCSVGMPPAGDYHMIQGSGPFTLIPGAINKIVTGVVWVPSIEYPCPDLSPFFDADDKAQQLVDNCFAGLSTSIFKPKTFDPISIFPNPYSLSSNASLQLKDLPLATKVSIFDINGRLLKTYKGETQMQLDLMTDLDNPSPGTYVVQVQAEGYEAKAYKFLIMK